MYQKLIQICALINNLLIDKERLVIRHVTELYQRDISGQNIQNTHR